ncbi:MAG: AbrB/MazE/SpoVT family DNA-binding domain-containing protein [Gammaproteobacteria bacterium]|nr:AbrB/MazE/SpoVT family DNA-binding domain-containing protein [Gammaproteobacteria bacterium]
MVLAKLTSKNQVTLPKAVVSACPDDTQYFEVCSESGRIVLTPVRITRADAVRAKLQQLGIKEDEVIESVNWAREKATNSE